MLVISISIEGITRMAETKQPEQKKTKQQSSRKLEIIGLILTLFPPAGFIVSIIAGRRAALRGRLSPLAIIGTVVNAILLLVITVAITTAFRGGHYIDARAKDPVVSDQITFATMKQVDSEIHRYINEKQQLPLKLDDLKSLDGFDADQLRDARGTSMVLSWSPQGCDSMETCKAYSLRAVGRKINKPMEIIYDAVENRTYNRWVPAKELDS